MNKQELIERIEDFPCEASLVTEMIRINKNTLLGWVKELDEPQLLKLKDVIARIKGFDRGTQEVWLNEILNELGSDYGLMKYKAGYEQGKFEGEWVGQQLKDADKIRKELNKPVVKQFVADWIKYCKRTGVKLQHALNMEDLYFYNYANQKDDLKLKEFFETENNQDIFARAWLNGYKVEKEKRYQVKMKGLDIDEAFLKFQLDDEYWYMGIVGEYKHARGRHTRKELENAGFGDVFNCPLFEVEEVEE